MAGYDVFTVYPSNARLYRASNATFTDYTAAAESAGVGDVSLGVAAANASTGDYFVIGHVHPFVEIELVISTAFVGTSSFAIEHWDGTAWAPLVDVIDGTDGLTTAGTNSIRWTKPSDWAENAQDGVTLYHMRIRWSAWVATTTVPLATTIEIIGDPLYAQSPLNPTLRWNQTMRPPLVNDPEMRVWRTVISACVGELAQSSWLVRWRTRSVVTAIGAHLDAFGKDLGSLRPDGWSDERFQNVLIPIEGGAQTNRPPSVTKALAAGLVNGDQTWLVVRPTALQYVVYFFSLTENEAKTYFNVLNLGRPTAVRLVLVYSPEAAPDVFTLDSSLLDGPDVLAFSSFSDP